MRLAEVGGRLAAASWRAASLTDTAFDLFLEAHPHAIPVLWRPYDWARDCAADVTRAGRSFPPVAGRGRGYVMRSI